MVSSNSRTIISSIKTIKLKERFQIQSLNKLNPRHQQHSNSLSCKVEITVWDKTLVARAITVKLETTAIVTTLDQEQLHIKPLMG